MGAPFDKSRPRPDVDRGTARPLGSVRRRPLKHHALGGTEGLSRGNQAPMARLSAITAVSPCIQGPLLLVVALAVAAPAAAAQTVVDALRLPRQHDARLAHTRWMSSFLIVGPSRSRIIQEPISPSLSRSAVRLDGHTYCPHPSRPGGLSGAAVVATVPERSIDRIEILVSPAAIAGTQCSPAAEALIVITRRRPARRDSAACGPNPIRRAT